MDRVMVFIDGPNLGRRVDLVKLLERLSGGREVIESTYYTSDPALLEMHLTSSPLGRLESFGFRISWLPRPQKRELVDVAMAVDIICAAYEDRFDVAVLVAGDADYLLPINRVRGLGKSVEVVAWRGNMSDALEEEFPTYLRLDAIRSEITLRR